MERWNRVLVRFGWALCVAFVAARGFLIAQTGAADYLREFLLPAGIAVGVWLAAHLLAYLATRFSSPLAACRVLLVAMAAVLSLACFYLRLPGMHYLLLLPLAASSCGGKNTPYLVFVFVLVGLWPVYFLPVRLTPAELATMAAVFLAALVLAALAASYIARLVRQTEEEARMNREAGVDALSGLGNQTAFYQALDRRILQFKKDHTPFGLILMDIDRFKPINAEQGKEMGDVVLRELAALIQEQLEDTDAAFRYGGEEFVILTAPERCHSMAQNIRQSFSKRRIEGMARPVTVSCGVCVYKQDFGGRREFFSAADKALTQAKYSGRNCVRMAQ